MAVPRGPFLERVGRAEDVEFAAAVAVAAMSYLGKGFVDHYNALGCGGRVEDRCMETGLGPEVFDCTGLVIRSICDVTGMTTDQFRRIRHLPKMESLTRGNELPFGTSIPKGYILFHHAAVNGFPLNRATHVLIHDERDQVLHATSTSYTVQQTAITSPTFWRNVSAVSPRLLLGNSKAS